MEETPKVYKLQDEIGDGFTAIYNVNDTYVDVGGADEEDKYYLMELPWSESPSQTPPPQKKQATLFEKIVALLVKKEVSVNIVIVDMETDE